MTSKHDNEKWEINGQNEYLKLNRVIELKLYVKISCRHEISYTQT